MSDRNYHIASEGRNASDVEPRTILLTKRAIAAAAGGRPITLVYRDFPATLLCELWKEQAIWVGKNKCLHLSSRYAVEWLYNPRCGYLLATVVDDRLLKFFLWTVNLNPDVKCHPTVFSASYGALDDEIPGPVLVLYGHDREISRLTRWVSQHNETDQLTLQDGHVDVTIPPAIQELVCGRSVDGVERLTRSRDWLVMESLLTGQAIIKPDGSADQRFVDANDYKEVYDLVRSKSLHPPEDAPDPLAVSMVHRANAHLEMLSQNHDEVSKAARLHKEGAANEQVEQRLITRRELTDLGNPRARITRRLVAYLKGMEDEEQGVRRFIQIGLNKKLSSGQWPEPRSVSALSKCLTTWSDKQVRTHFHQLVKEELITAERKPANGPWLYKLPKRLATYGNVFAQLPSPEEVENALKSSSATGIAGRWPQITVI